MSSRGRRDPLRFVWSRSLGVLAIDRPRIEGTMHNLTPRCCLPLARATSKAHLLPCFSHNPDSIAQFIRPSRRVGASLASVGLSRRTLQAPRCYPTFRRLWRIPLSSAPAKATAVEIASSRLLYRPLSFIQQHSPP